MVGIEGRPEMPAIPPGQIATIEREANASRVVGIYTSPQMGAPMKSHTNIQAIAGIGLESDRYAAKIGVYSESRIGKPGRIPDEDRQISIISTQGLEQANAQLENEGIAPFSAEETRRNLILDYDAEALNKLVGKRFKIGEVEMEGVELCTPCRRPAVVLKRVSDGKAFEQAFGERGGLRARVVSDGTINISDVITVFESQE